MSSLSLTQNATTTEREEMVSDLASPADSSLSADIIREMIPNHRGNDFLPAGALEMILKKPAVAAALREVGLPAPDRYTSLICEPSPYDTYLASAFRLQDLASSLQSPHVRGSSPSYRNIFAILVHADLLNWLPVFVDHHLDDSNLPVPYPRGPKSREKIDSVWHPIFHLLGPSKARCLYFLQWEITVPCFRRPQDAILHYSFDGKVVLPFLQYQEPSRPILGGQSDVRKVRLHPDHIEFEDADLGQRKQEFALKCLHDVPEAEENFHIELQSLARWELLLPAHRHITRLLATYEVVEGPSRQNFFLFPWADGNLFDFLRDPAMDCHSTTVEAAVWLAEQMHGLANALEVLHSPHELSSTADDDKGRDETAGIKLYGYHGDLKPANILIFNQGGKGESLGTLVLSDAGLSSFHRELSKSLPTARGFTITYAAPEVSTIRDGEARAGPKADIWSLGCVFLEMATWYLMGSRGTEEFARRREAKDAKLSFISTDSFSGVDLGGDWAVKPAVSEWISSLRSFGRCSGFIHDLVDVITKMIVGQPRERLTATAVTGLLGEMREKCNEDKDYLKPLTRRSGMSVDLRFLRHVKPPEREERWLYVLLGAMNPSRLRRRSTNSKEKGIMD